MTMPAEAQPLVRKLIIAHSDPTATVRLARRYRNRGWHVVQARSGAEVRQLVRTLQPALVVLDANLDEESGWLICAKLRREQPSLRVVLTTRRPTATDRRFARFVGARGLIDPCNRLRLSAPPKPAPQPSPWFSWPRPPYFPSPAIGQPIAAICARSWCVRPVTGRSATAASRAPACSMTR